LGEWSGRAAAAASDQDGASGGGGGGGLGWTTKNLQERVTREEDTGIVVVHELGERLEA